MQTETKATSEENKKSRDEHPGWAVKLELGARSEVWGGGRTNKETDRLGRPVRETGSERRIRGGEGGRSQQKRGIYVAVEPRQRCHAQPLAVSHI